MDTGRRGFVSAPGRESKARLGGGGEPLPLPLGAQAFTAQLYCCVQTGRKFQNIRHTLFKRKDRNTFQNQQELVGAALLPFAGLLGDTPV